MKTISNKKMAVFIFAGLAVFTLFVFQNCSSSGYILSGVKPVQANEITDMLKASEQELETTKGAIKRHVANGLPPVEQNDTDPSKASTK